MALKTFPCTSCGKPIEVPEDFKAAVIECPGCKAPHSRHTERAYVSPRATRMAAGAPLVAANMPPPTPGASYPPAAPAPLPTGPAPSAPYPGRPYFPPPSAPKSNLPLWIGLSVVGVLVIGGAMLVLLPVLIGVTEREMPPEPGPYGPRPAVKAPVGEVPENWVKYASTSGRFRAEFPVNPKISTEDFESGIGRRTGTLASAQVGGIDFFVHFWDLGLEHPAGYVINLEDATSVVANYTRTAILEQKPIKFQNNVGTYAVLRRVISGNRIHFARVRVGNRVFTICADGNERDATPFYERFFNSFNFDEELNYLEPLYFELAPTLDLQTRQHVAMRVRGSGGKAPYVWNAEGLPPGLSLITRDATSCELNGTPEQTGTFPATITLVDEFKRQFKSSLSIQITKGPENAGTMQAPLVKGRAGMPVSGKVTFKPAQTPESVNWKWDANKVPKGVKLEVFTPDIVISGIPAEGGKFSLELQCVVKFKNLELELTATGTLEFDLMEAWPDVTSHFGKSTLLIVHNGPYSPDPWKFLLTELARKCGQLGEGDKINLWTLTGFGRSVSTRSAAPQPASTGESVARLLQRDAEKPNQRGGAAHKDLAGVPIEDFANYDKLIFVTDLPGDDTADLASLETQLERMASVPGLNIEIVIINKEIPAELQSWLADKKIALTHYNP